MMVDAAISPCILEADPDPSTSSSSETSAGPSWLTATSSCERLLRASSRMRWISLSAWLASLGHPSWEEDRVVTAAPAHPVVLRPRTVDPLR